MGPNLARNRALRTEWSLWYTCTEYMYISVYPANNEYWILFVCQTNTLLFRLASTTRWSTHCCKRTLRGMILLTYFIQGRDLTYVLYPRGVILLSYSKGRNLTDARWGAVLGKQLSLWRDSQSSLVNSRCDRDLSETWHRNGERCTCSRNCNCVKF